MGKIIKEFLTSKGASNYFCKNCTPITTISNTDNLISVNAETVNGTAFIFLKIINVFELNKRKGLIEKHSLGAIFDENPTIDTKTDIWDIYCKFCLSHLGYKVIDKGSTNFILLRKRII